ncbi:MAG: MYXO-CTERM sorting domain-containing protein, partial [Polyangiaceae bacterium]
CAAAHMATLLGNSAAHDKYLAAGQKARDAILASLRAPDGTIGQSTEALAAKKSWLDAAAIEALNFGLVDPKKHSATATLSSMKRGLVPPSGQGFMRNDDGAYYDSQEWVFVDFRSERALELNGDSLASSLLAWNVAQAVDNFSEFSELHDATTADYAGASPMVGFGAGAYLLTLAARGSAVTPACDSFAAEAGGEEADAGVDGGADSGTGDGGVVIGGKNPADGGAGASNNGPGESSGGCGCSTVGAENGSNALALAALAFAFVGLGRVRRRK